MFEMITMQAEVFVEIIVEKSWLVSSFLGNISSSSSSSSLTWTLDCVYQYISPSKVLGASQDWKRMEKCSAHKYFIFPSFEIISSFHPLVTFSHLSSVSISLFWSFAKHIKHKTTSFWTVLFFPFRKWQIQKSRETVRCYVCIYKLETKMRNMFLPSSSPSSSSNHSSKERERRGHKSDSCLLSQLLKKGTKNMFSFRIWNVFKRWRLILLMLWKKWRRRKKV